MVIRRSGSAAARAGIFFITAARLAAQSPELLPELVVMAERRGTKPEEAPALAEWTREDLRLAAPRTIDELLADEPAFSLYRRQTSVFGNPTSSGVSLRNSGATAASRSLVLRDGIPQNDPFGGWVYWARYDPSVLESLRIVPSAQSAVWGNQSPAGVIQMASRPAFDERGVLQISGGEQRSHSESLSKAFVVKDETLALSFAGFAMRSDGFFALARTQRGSIDRKLDIEYHGAELNAAWRPAAGLTVEPGVSYYWEERGNGTPLARNQSEALDYHLRLTSTDGPVAWQALAYHQRRDFSQVFSSVDATRDAETLALDQFDVPGKGSGGALTVLWESDGPWTLSAGVDARRVTGETNETVGTFRNREAGGNQTFAGVFAAGTLKPSSNAVQIDASLRADTWWLQDGRRIEDSLTNGTRLREEFHRDRNGTEPSAALSVRGSLRENFSAELSAGTSFRLPTLNELHRPFRVRNDIVEANPELDPERFFTLEGGLAWHPSSNLRLRTKVFHHWIHDAISNVPITDEALLAELFGMIPAGGSGSQRQNVDRARVLGVQAELEWQATESFEIRAAGIWTQTMFTRSQQQPALEGKSFPQAPDLRINAGFNWKLQDGLRIFAGYEYGDSQFDDSLAQRKIPSYSSATVGTAWDFNGNTFQLRIDNLFGEKIHTGLSSDGLSTLAAPRSLWVSVEREF